MKSLSRIYRKSLTLLKKLIEDTFKDVDVSIVLFGSRSTGEYKNTSDLDLAIIFGEKADKWKLSLLREKIESSNIPYKVDLVDLSEVSEDFKQNALKGQVIWKN